MQCFNPFLVLIRRKAGVRDVLFGASCHKSEHFRCSICDIDAQHSSN